LKIGDIDARDNPRLCLMVSDKALAVGGGVLEAILSRPELRATLWM
jgi:xanthine dehydrogenase accessory factor